MNRSRPFSKRGAYTESDNAPARNRVWPRETNDARLSSKQHATTTHSIPDVPLPIRHWRSTMTSVLSPRW